MPPGVSAYVPLANITVATAATDITFSSINQGYRDLVLVGYINALSDGYVFINGATATTNYNTVVGTGNGSSASTTQSSNNAAAQLVAGTNGVLVNAVLTINFMDYSATDKHKTYLIRMNDPGIWTQFRTTRFASTSAITSITLNTGGVWPVGTSFALYGVSQ